MIRISDGLSKEEIELIIFHSNRLISLDLKKLNDTQKLIVVVGKIYEEVIKNNSNIIINIVPCSDEINNHIEIGPSIFKNLFSYELVGRITLSSDLLTSNLSGGKHLFLLLFMFYHEFDHFRRLCYLQNTKIDTPYKERWLKEFAVIHIMGCSKFYGCYHDSFDVEKRADNYAYRKTIDLLKELNLSNSLDIYKFIRKTYFSNREYDVVSYEKMDHLLDKYFCNILKYKSSEFKDLSNYIPVLKKIKSRKLFK